MLRFFELFLFPFVAFGLFILPISYLSYKLKDKYPRFHNTINYIYDNQWLFYGIAIVFVIGFYFMLDIVHPIE